MAVRYGSKKYYKEKYEDKCTECGKSLDDTIKLREAFEFVFNHTKIRIELRCLVMVVVWELMGPRLHM